jgi:hypothetical protein
MSATLALLKLESFKMKACYLHFGTNPDISPAISRLFNLQVAREPVKNPSPEAIAVRSTMRIHFTLSRLDFGIINGGFSSMSCKWTRSYTGISYILKASVG